MPRAWRGNFCGAAEDRDCQGTSERPHGRLGRPAGTSLTLVVSSRPSVRGSGPPCSFLFRVSGGFVWLFCTTLGGFGRVTRRGDPVGLRDLLGAKLGRCFASFATARGRRCGTGLGWMADSVNRNPGQLGPVPAIFGGDGGMSGRNRRNVESSFVGGKQ